MLNLTSSTIKKLETSSIRKALIAVYIIHCIMNTLCIYCVPGHKSMTLYKLHTLTCLYINTTVDVQSNVKLTEN